MGKSENRTTEIRRSQGPGVQSISAQESQEEIECTKAKE